MTATLTKPLREEYSALHGGVEMLRTVADSINRVPLESLQRGVEAAYRFLTREVLPLGRAENQVEFPIIDRLIGSSDATAAMHEETAEVARLTGDLRAIKVRLCSADAAAREANELRRVLYGLHELLKVHLANEENVYLPLLDSRLDQSAIEAMVAAMEDVERRARRG